MYFNLFILIRRMYRIIFFFWGNLFLHPMKIKFLRTYMCNKRGLDLMSFLKKVGKIYN
jgi:hypothetical protein